MFKYFYILIATIVYIVAIPYLLFKSRTKKYAQAIPAKFFLKNNPKFKQNKIWFHSCSHGEVSAIKPLIEKFNSDEVVISTMTNTGFDTALKLTKDVRFLPFEIFLPFWIVKQKALVVMEAELWYMLFLIAKQKGAKTFLINARISDRSYKNYLKFRWFYKKIFKNIDKVFAQSKIDKIRLEELGATNIEVVGNIKLVNLPKITKQYMKPQTLVITAGSTHESEEELILNAWDKTIGKLIIVPRHPERFNSVYNLIENRYKNSDISFCRFSQANNFDSDIVLVDLMGELNNIYAISDVVILGGGFIQSAGGHNPIEPAFFNTILISGKTIFNQKSLFEAINDYYIIDNEQLKEYLNDLNNLKKSSLGQIGTIDPIIDAIKENKNGKSI